MRGCYQKLNLRIDPLSHLHLALHVKNPIGKNPQKKFWISTIFFFQPLKNLSEQLWWLVLKGPLVLKSLGKKGFFLSLGGDNGESRIPPVSPLFREGIYEPPKLAPPWPTPPPIFIPFVIRQGSFWCPRAWWVHASCQTGGTSMKISFTSATFKPGGEFTRVLREKDTQHVTWL